ncbi:diadenylate cyclase CdaA [Sinanaerobacter chloroacetimidivorans]|uniref:Diadenylate cyclase n=1 Tax=Sinanaerobacter chloroacetimidivorans TaxID=2818044 RepID=A0A8J7VZU1_9FIRM|nr:diadenylate cyclase CdaA [Sinanaerobacter chloroacetimidivorans]MBR0598187.1 diadenylate cyclase CdaA [Sinanaerobacter chloroacetimidivorans]
MIDTFNNLMSGVGFSDVIDILIVGFVIYKILGFIRETRAEQLVKGLLILVAITFISDIFNLYTLNWILENAFQLGVVALVVVFQPELRRALEYVGRSKFIPPQFAQLDKEKAKLVTAAIIKAVDFFSNNKVGALIIMERETALNDIIETGTIIDAEISTELLGNLFYEGAPLHDGATIVRGDRIIAAGCVLPLTQSKTLSKDLGTRHRAGIGITENSDAISLIVSEESGIISIAVDGKLSRFLDIKTVEKTLLNIYLSQISEEKVKVPFLNLLFRRRKDAE